jgi:hypothetical protein
MSTPQLRVDFIDTTEAHVAGFAHKHDMEIRSSGIEHVAGTLWLAHTHLQRECHTLKTPDIGDFVFDVTSIKLVLSRRLVEFQMMRANLTQEWVDYTMKTYDCEEAGIARFAVADLDRPGIMVFFGPGRSAQIDGNHRLVRSWREGRKTFDMAMVAIADIVPFVCRPGAEDKLFETAKQLEEELGLI